MQVQFSYRLFKLIEHTLPRRSATRICRLLGLKVPTTPAMLAGSLTMMAGSIMRSLHASLSKINEANPDFKASLVRELDAEIGMELLWALYGIALSVLKQDDFTSEPSLFQLYAAETIKGLETLLEGERALGLFEQIGQEARKLYLTNEPTARELADMKGVNFFDEEIATAEREHNWMMSYLVKAQIRITSKLPVEPRSIWYLNYATFFLIDLSASVDFFKTLRPVLS